MPTLLAALVDWIGSWLACASWFFRKWFWVLLAWFKAAVNKPLVIPLPRGTGGAGGLITPVPLAQAVPGLPIEKVLACPPGEIPPDERSASRTAFYKLQVWLYSHYSPMQPGLPSISTDPDRASEARLHLAAPPHPGRSGVAGRIPAQSRSRRARGARALCLLYPQGRRSPVRVGLDGARQLRASRGPAAAGREGRVRARWTGSGRCAPHASTAAWAASRPGRTAGTSPSGWRCARPPRTSRWYGTSTGCTWLPARMSPSPRATVCPRRIRCCGSCGPTSTPRSRATTPSRAARCSRAATSNAPSA